MTRIDSVPVRSWWGALLCRWGWHSWKATGAKQHVIPTGNALLIRRREDTDICTRRDCGAKRIRTWEREP
jgi:hypothetical protein